MKKTFIAANWKMYKTCQQALESAVALRSLLEGQAPAGREVIIFPQFMAVPVVAEVFNGTECISTGAQDVYPAVEGAFTGEISPAMLKDGGAEWVLTGHSERRHVLGEDDNFVGDKTAFALEHGLNVMLCIGETLEERERGDLEVVLRHQLNTALAHIPASVNEARLAVAYEPVWAIGTGKVAGPEEIVEAHALTRKLLEETFPHFGKDISILYGGSVKPANAASILMLDNVDGLLVGGASLDAASFNAIISA